MEEGEDENGRLIAKEAENLAARASGEPGVGNFRFAKNGLHSYQKVRTCDLESTKER